MKRTSTILYLWVLLLVAPSIVVAQTNIFDDFPWLTTYVDQNNCTTKSIAIYESGTYNFLLVTDQMESSKLYLETGTFYCEQTATYNCVEAYQLGDAVATWTCPATSTPTPPDCGKFSGTVFFEACDDGNNFVFIRTPEGRILDLYYAEGISYDAINGQKVNFDYEPATFDSPCSIADEAITITCLEIEIPTPIAGDCNNHTGTFFFRNCDDGQLFYFLITEDGTVYDPYFDGGVSFNPIQGQTVKFDFVDAAFSSPCSIAEKAISITCLEVVENTATSRDCDKYSGEMFFQNCDDGTRYFFIRTSEGRILDPYYDVGISFNQFEGAKVKFDYISASFSSPCSIADEAVTITCIAEFVPPVVTNEIPENFEEYDVIYRICRGDTLRIENLSRQIQCNCPDNPQAPCDNLPFTQWGKWTGSTAYSNNTSFILAYPTQTTVYENKINGYFCGLAGPSFGPSDVTKFLVIVEGSLSCDIPTPNEQTVFAVNGCVGDTVRVPAPAPGTCPIGPPIVDGPVEILVMSSNYLTVRLLESGSFSYAISLTEGPTGFSCPTAKYTYIVNASCGEEETVTMEETEETTETTDNSDRDDAVFTDFPWLTDIVDPANCDASTIEVYEAGAYNFLFVETVEGGTLYFENGSFYCAESPTYNCRSAYNLSNPILNWSCTPEQAILPNTEIGQAFSRQKIPMLKIAPNPTNGLVEIFVPSTENQQLNLLDIYGKQLQTVVVGTNTSIRLDLSNYQSGVYYIELLSNNNRTIQKVIKQ